MRKILKAIYAIWYREFKVFQREKSRIISSVFLPLFWYFIFGGGMGAMTSGKAGDYQHFIFPGFLAMTIIFSSIFNGAYIVWDKKVDFLKEVLIAPISRSTIFIGKMIGGMTDALLQACILLIIGIFLGIPFTVTSVPLTLVMLIFFAAGISSLGLIIGSFLESPEGFGLVSSFVVYPLFLLSGALYSLSNISVWLRILTRIDPATYAVDGLRGAILGISSLPYITNLAIMAAFDIALISIGTWAFRRMKL